MKDKPTVWRMYECEKGNRWTSTTENYELSKCNFSGCNCNGKVTLVDSTTNRSIAHNWFRRKV